MSAERGRGGLRCGGCGDPHPAGRNVSGRGIAGSTPATASVASLLLALFLCASALAGQEAGIPASQPEAWKPCVVSHVVDADTWDCNTSLGFGLNIGVRVRDWREMDRLRAEMDELSGRVP